MTEIPESLLRRSAEAKAKALGLPVEQVLAEMKGEAPAHRSRRPRRRQSEARRPTAEETVADEMEEAAERSEEIEQAVESDDDEPAPAEEVARRAGGRDRAEVVADDRSRRASRAADARPRRSRTVRRQSLPGHGGAVGGGRARDRGRACRRRGSHAVEDRPAAGGDGGGDGPARAMARATAQPVTTAPGTAKVAAVVRSRPDRAPRRGRPEGVRTQRLLTVVKARAIQTGQDRANRQGQHLAPPDDHGVRRPAGDDRSGGDHVGGHPGARCWIRPTSTRRPTRRRRRGTSSGSRSCLSYFDPQMAGVTVPTITGLIGFMMVPYVDRNPSTKPPTASSPSLLYSVFLAGAATLTIFGVLFRGQGFNFSYPW